MGHSFSAAEVSPTLLPDFKEKTPMGRPTTTMGQAMASTTLHPVEQSLLAARPIPPTTTTMLGQLLPRPNSHFIDLIDGEVRDRSMNRTWIGLWTGKWKITICGAK